jgi:hypothetical protein
MCGSSSLPRNEPSGTTSTLTAASSKPSGDVTAIGTGTAYVDYQHRQHSQIPKLLLLISLLSLSLQFSSKLTT